MPDQAWYKKGISSGSFEKRKVKFGYRRRWI